LIAQNTVVEHIMSYREADKVLGTYVIPFRALSQIGDGRAHANFKVTRVSSGRLATSDPNLLAIPVRSELGEQCRYGFVAPDGHVLYDSDLSQIEMRQMAHESRDPKLCKVFDDGLDVHSMTASEMFSTPVSQVEKWQRNAAKQVGFGIINLISEYGLRDQMILYRAVRKDGSRWSVDDCATMIREWFNIYRGVKQFHNDVIAEARATGLSRESIGGRIRYVPGVWSQAERVRNETEREACSHRIQGGAAAILKRAMKAIWDCIKDLDGVEPILSIHDEVVIQVRDDPTLRDLVEMIVQGAFTTTTKLRVPIEADGGYGLSWGEAKH
jgi:DNA polymerase-1